MESSLEQTTPTQNSPANDHAVFLYIPIWRLIILSILSLGLYELYWMYKNWRYLKERDHLHISPFWRAWFGIFNCHSLLGKMDLHKDLNRGGHSRIPPALLATVWVVLTLAASAISRLSDSGFSIYTYLIPTYLCFVPAQLRVNKANRSAEANVPFKKWWSKGHILCLLIGVLSWTIILMPEPSAASDTATEVVLPGQYDCLFTAEDLQLYGLTLDQTGNSESTTLTTYDDGSKLLKYEYDTSDKSEFTEMIFVVYIDYDPNEEKAKAMFTKNINDLVSSGEKSDSEFKPADPPINVGDETKFFNRYRYGNLNGFLYEMRKGNICYTILTSGLFNSSGELFTDEINARLQKLPSIL